VAFINNMPDPALADTESQFFELLDLASGDIPVYLRLYSLIGVPRTERGERHVSSFYYPFEDLWQNRFDAVIVTGTEPHHADLREEPYWNALTEVLDWAEQNTKSTILSCLAAHAGVLHRDGVQRHPLPEKKYGVFEATSTCDHPLVNKAVGRICFPHSRWNEVRENELRASGYLVLAKSEGAGVDLFVKKGKSLFVHFQGHPEYDAQTLLKEYRRDVKRFIRGERSTYPSMPYGYFDETSVRLLNEVRETVLLKRHDETMGSLLESIAQGLRRHWQSSATAMYRNWLGYIASQKSETRVSPTFSDLADSRWRAVSNA
jgi:homoserine O-succinyltransferase